MSALTFKDFVTWGFCGLISFLVFKTTSSLEKVNESVSILNTQVAVLIVKEPYQAKINDNLEARIKFLEQISRGNRDEK